MIKPSSRSATRWTHFKSLLAREISTLTAFYDEVIQWQPRPDDDGTLLEEIRCASKRVALDLDALPAPTANRSAARRSLILLNGNINHHFDIEQMLGALKAKLDRFSRVACVAYNPYLAWLYRLANRLGLRQGELPSTFVTRADIRNLAQLAGYRVLRIKPVGIIPWHGLGLGTLLNRALTAIPLVRDFSLVHLIVLQPLTGAEPEPLPSLTVIVPARNERGNIENAVTRLPQWVPNLEIVFVEGNSSDGTWEEILRVQEQYGTQRKILAFKQPGKGKNDAVREGIARSTGDLITILDADLTMPPELLGRFVNAYLRGDADFVNGTRLVYPMEGEAMRFLNHLGNVFFAKALSAVLDTPLGDSLCGTKLFTRADYRRFVAWRKAFGEFDPFGDFELLFPAATLGLGIVDVPIRYLARTYGTTNIHRFRHGWMLLKMTLIGLFKIRMSPGTWMQSVPTAQTEAPALRLSDLASN